MSQVTNKIKVRRLSQLPNRFGSFTYAIEQDAADLVGLDGVVEGKNGSMLFSPVRIGAHDKSFVAPCRINVVGDKKYVNLIDVTADQIGEMGAIMKQAARAGFDVAAMSTVAAQNLFAKFNKTGNSQAIGQLTPPTNGAGSNPTGPETDAARRTELQAIIDNPASSAEAKATATEELMSLI